MFQSIKKFLLIQLLLLTFAATNTLFAQQQGVGGSSFHKNDITYSTKVATPHIPWASKIAGGPIRGFFIPSVQYGRDMVEVMQRLSLEPTTVSIDRSWDINCWGIGDYYGHEFRGDRDDFQIVYGYAEKDLTGPAPFEVIVIPGLNGWTRLTRASRDAILRRVESGAGLVLIHPFVGDVKGHPFKGDEKVGDERLWTLSPLVGVADDTVTERGYPEINREAVVKGKWETSQKHFITEGLPLELLPEGNFGGSFYKYRASEGEVLIKSGQYPVVAVKNYGRGRVVALAYVEEGFTPQSIDPIETRTYWDYWEYQYSLLARSILWASGRETPLRISAIQAEENGRQINFNLTSTKPLKATFEIRVKGEDGGQIASDKFERGLVAGENSFNFPLASLRPRSGWQGGKQIFDIIIRDAQTGETLNWGSTLLQIPKSAMLTTLRPAVDVYQRGETLSAVLGATGDLTDVQMRLKVADDLGRLLAIIDKPARGERTVTYQLNDFLGKSAYLTAELVNKDGAVIDQLRAKPVMVVQEARRQKEYTALVSFGGTKHYLQDAQMRQVRAVAADTGFTWSGAVDNSLNVPRGSFGVYWYDRGPTTPEGIEKAIAEFRRTNDFEALGYLTKKELYKRTGDKKFLQRTPSFSDSSFMQRLVAIARATARNKARYNMDYYFVGDEGSLTSYGDPVDFDWSAPAIDAFRKWLKQEYGTLAALNSAWKTNYSDWNKVVPFTTEEAQKSGNFAPWADHRTFMEQSFAEAYRLVREGVTEADPQAHIAVSGTQATNAYNGADWYQLDQVIDDFLSYDGGNQWDIHRSFAKPQSMIGFWTGYGSNGLAVQNAIWTAAMHNVLHPNIFWMYSFLDPDLGHSKSARDMGAAFRSLRFEGIGKLFLESERQQDGIAIHYSMPSVHGATMLGYHQRGSDDDDENNAPKKAALSFPANRDGWVRLVKDLGMQFDFISAPQIEQNKMVTGKYKVIILPLSVALSNEELKAMQTFVNDGGVVIADAGAGMMDEHGAWRENKQASDFFGIESTSERARKFVNSAGRPLVTSDGAQWKLNADALAGLSVVEAGLKASSGSKPLVRIGDSDAVIAQQHGKGWAIYLNLLFDQYPKERREKSGGAASRVVINALLAHIGVQPKIEVVSSDGQRLTQVQVARYRFGNSEVLALVKDNVAVEGIVGQDGVRVLSDAGLGRVASQEIVIRLPQKYFVTDIRTGKKMGQTNLVKTSVVVGDAVVLGLESEPNRIAITRATPAQSTAPLGSHLSFSISSTKGSRRLIRCRVLGPDGQEMPSYAQNVLLENLQGNFVLPTAINDAPGQYTVQSNDVVSGATAEIKVTLR